MIKVSKIIVTLSCVLLGVSKFAVAADVSILDLNLKAHETLGKTGNNGGGVKFVNHILNHGYDFITTQEGDSTTYELTSEKLTSGTPTMKSLYGIDKPGGRIYYKIANWHLEKIEKFKLTPDEKFLGTKSDGVGSRFASLALFKSTTSADRYITIVTTHYCIDWYYGNHDGGSKGCQLESSTSIQYLKDSIDEQVKINIASYTSQADQIVKGLGVSTLGELAVEKDVTRQILVHVSDSIKIAEEINKFAPAGSAVFFAGDFNNQYVSNPGIKEDIINPEKIKLSTIEALAVENALKAKGLTQTKFAVPPTFEGGPVIDFAYYSGLTLVSAVKYAMKDEADPDNEKNTSDHDGMRLQYNFVPSSNATTLR